MTATDLCPQGRRHACPHDVAWRCQAYVCRDLQERHTRQENARRVCFKSFLASIHACQRRDFWERTRGVTDLACQHRLANFARIYPRYRDLSYLQTFMPRWDSAITRIIAHDRHVLVLPRGSLLLCPHGPRKPS